MALVSSGSSNASKGITISSQGTALVDMYEVPAGRKFVGKLWTNNNNYYGNINGVDMRQPYASSYFQRHELEITLFAGDIVKSSASSSDITMLQGTESDA